MKFAAKYPQKPMIKLDYNTFSYSLTRFEKRLSLDISRSFNNLKTIFSPNYESMFKLCNE